MRRNPRVRAAVRRVPGLASAYHGARKWGIRRLGVATLDYPGARIRIRAGTREIVHSRLHPVAKEPWTVDWIEQNLRPGDVLYDIGANVGAYSLIAAKASGAQAASVVAFEPGYATYASLCDNVLLNDVGATVMPLPIVLGERTRLGSLGYHTTSAGSALHVLDGDGAYRQPVLVYAVDDLIELFGLPRPTLIKLDVDGAEVAVLAGARETLRHPDLRSLIVEVENDRANDVIGELAAAGFTLTLRIDERDGQPLPGIWYGVFDRD